MAPIQNLEALHNTFDMYMNNGFQFLSNVLSDKYDLTQARGIPIIPISSRRLINYLFF